MFVCVSCVCECVISMYVKQNLIHSSVLFETEVL